jgi:hypothetical protein
MSGRRPCGPGFQKQKHSSQVKPGEKAGAMKKQLFLVALLSLGALISTSTIQADVRLNVPEENEPPFYARIHGAEFAGGEEMVIRTDDWAAIVFYREPGCVPAGFNLLSFFDFGAVGGSCPLTIEGFEIWREFPPTGVLSGPIQTKSRGLGAVPIWFVAWPEMQALLADRVLTTAELEAAETLLKGTAQIFDETLHPFPAVQVPHLSIQASGELDDGRHFQLQVAVAGFHTDCCSPQGDKQQVRIEFR